MNLRRWAGSKWSLLLAGLLVGASVALFTLTTVGTTDDQSRMRRYTACLATWADQYTARAERITKVNAATAAATAEYIHALTVALGDAIAQDQAALTRDLPAYEKAAADYEAAAKASKEAAARDPIPDAPKFQCR